LRLKREILKKKRGWKYVYLVWVSQVVDGGRDVGMGAGDALTVAFSRLMRAGVWPSMPLHLISFRGFAICDRLVSRWTFQST